MSPKTKARARAAGVHPVLAANDAYVAYLNRGDVLAERREALATHVLAQRAADAEALREHEADVRIAVEAGSPIPKPPKPSDWSHLDAAEAIQRAAEMQHRQQRTAVLAEAGETGVMDGLKDRERLRMGRLRPLVEDLLAEMREIEADATVYRDVVQALDLLAGLGVHPSRAERIDTKPSAADVIAAVLGGQSLLDPAPILTVNKEPRIEHVHPDDEATRIGAKVLGQHRGIEYPGFGNHDDREKVPTNSGRGVEI